MCVVPIKNERIKNNERIKRFVHLFLISNPNTEGTIPDHENKPIKNERIENKERVRKESTILKKMNIKQRSSCAVASMKLIEMHVEFPTSTRRTEGTIHNHENKPIKNERIKNNKRAKKELERVQRSSHSLLPMCESLHACNFTEDELTQVWQNILLPEGR